ncbi:MAG: hypothetical protein WCY15_06285 [Phenylobacterium sp.]|jgi:hypothetical protein|uniref:hypothetical protein n=1 Tax=Phenylobacterium sp. TaxID=1871053 RepID=UPI002A368981|nr:hypothetical protein [Phenylobacterium sp.]MDX9997853.1 hypothetical protein [Phenylobacterium sp.]
MTSAAELLRAELGRRPPDQRARYIKEVLAHAAAGLSLLEGETAAAEAVYRLADAMVSTPPRD